MKNIQQAYLDIAKKLRIPGAENEKEDIIELVRGHLSQESAGQWLLIMDNANNVDMWFEQRNSSSNSARLFDLLPRSENGSILFTTRNRKAAIKFAAPQNVLHVSEMDEVTAIQMLSNLLLATEAIEDETSVHKLLGLLEFLPLTITQAAAYINRNEISLAEYISLLNNQEENIIDIFSEDFEDEGRYHGTKNPIATTWLISFKQIRLNNPLAADYLALMSCFDPKAIPLSLLSPAATKKQEIDAIGILSAYSFISKRANGISVDLHRLVHLATRNWLRKERLLVQWATNAATRLSEVLPDTRDGTGLHREEIQTWRAYLPHARFVVNSSAVPVSFEAIRTLQTRFGNCLRIDGKYNEAEIILTQVMKNAASILGADHPDTLDCMADVVKVYQCQGKLREAEELAIDCLQIGKRIEESKHTSVQRVMMHLAFICRADGRYEEAERLVDEVLKSCKGLLGDEHILTLASLNHLCTRYVHQQRWKEAEDLGLHLVRTSRRIVGNEHPQTLTFMHNLMWTYFKQGALRNKEAEELGMQVVKVETRVMGKEHPSVLEGMGLLAQVYEHQSRFHEAEALKFYVLETRKKVLGVKHPDTLSGMHQLAFAWRNLGRHDEAIMLLEECIELRTGRLGKKHWSTLRSLELLALLYYETGRLHEAEVLQLDVLEGTRGTLGMEHPATMGVMYSLAIMWKNLGRNDEAVALMEECFELRKQFLSLDHPHTHDSQEFLSKWRQEE